jgi:D-3-phosphoglycerate dehydrogenase / 2-oxoglutarate reductase
VTKPFRVLISDDMSARAAEILSASPRIEVDVRTGLTPGDLRSIIADYNGLVVRSATKVTSEIIDAAVALEIIGRAGIGVDNIDVTAASRRGILVENAPSGNSVTTAEHAISLLLSLARQIPQATASLRAGKWEKSKFKGRELFGKTLGVIGLGNIGRIVASRARGLEMRVAAYDPFLGLEAATRLGVDLVTLDELYAQADFITIHTPLTAETEHLIDDAAFAKMKDGVLIVNAARGGIVHEGALLAALEAGKVAGAALDVFEQEPPAADHPLLAHPNVIGTPHLGASTKEAQVKVAVELAEQIVAYVERGEIRNAVNVAAVSGEVLGRLQPWLELAGHIGALVGQLAHADGGKGFVDELSVEVTGEPAELGATACTGAALVGLLRTFMDVPVNQVNARVIAADRGLSIREVKLDRDRDLASSIAVTAGGSRYVKGTLYHVGDRVEARIAQIDGFLVEVRPQGHILAVTNQDRPGVIGSVGTLLGERGINVNSMHVGLDEEAGVALALWNLDSALPDELVAAVRDLPLVSSAQVIEL